MDYSTVVAIVVHVRVMDQICSRNIPHFHDQAFPQVLGLKTPASISDDVPAWSYSPL